MMSYAPRTTRQRSAQSYASIGLETEVLSATPERLISLLMQGALAAMGKAALYMQHDNHEGRRLTISKAIDIVDSGLKASVDREAGGEVASSLVASYDLIIRHLLLANLNNSRESLEIAQQMLGTVSQAWHEATMTPKPIEQTAGA
ncbi:flagellar export chaperone FliS [Paracandidimonas soli]|uniref:Flagellar secretion chaperone FliS n=1 Tax=Paracandidimonas soli TaxID=1917182 RepID=A0A4R3VB57_9BURK|nr:flagellar protein FliS [Paracandidimonas soli]